MHSLCVYCGSSPGRSEAYTAAARDLASCMVVRGIRLVYGGASVGMMGVLADTVLELGGEVVGVIPENLVRREVAHPGLTDLHVTDSMHQRKLRMSELADAFLALPGGIGTLEELFEVWTWAQLGLHHKPCGLLNVSGYYDGLIDFLDHGVSEAFIRPAYRAMLMVGDEPGGLLDRMAAHGPPGDRLPPPKRGS